MNNFLKRICFLCIVSMVLMNIPSSGPMARCSGSFNFGQAEQFTVRSPGAYLIDKTFTGEWWAYLTGNPEPGKGNDRGKYINNLANDWLDYWPALKAYYMNVNKNDWFNPGNDGCILGLSEDPLMVVSFDDISKDRDRSYFAIAIVNRTPNVHCEFDFDRVGSDITLVEIPRPAVRDVSRNQLDTPLNIALSWPRPSSGFYKAPEVKLGFSDLVTGYEIYYRHSLFLPVDRETFGSDPEASWVLAGRFKDTQGVVKVPQPKKKDQNLYLAVRLVYDGETPFRSRYVGASSDPITFHTGLLPSVHPSIHNAVLKRVAFRTFEIEWEIEGDEKAAGFNILRSYRSDRGFTKINRETIRRKPRKSEPSPIELYRYQDHLKAAHPQNYFFYRIEAVDAGGKRLGISDTMKAMLKEDL